MLSRLREELGSAFDPDRPVRISRAPGRLDVMGGIADYTGSLVCEMPLSRAAALALQERSDRDIQVFSFNLLDQRQPHTLRMHLDVLADASPDSLRRELADPARRWAGYLLGCLCLLHNCGYVNLRSAQIRGLSLALLSTVPLGAGVSSSAAIEVATMMNLADHFGLRKAGLGPMELSSLCQQVENQIVGAPCGIMDQVTSVCGQAGALLKLLCQPHELQGYLHLPAGLRVLGINSNVRHSVGGGMYGRTRCAAFMGHRIILEIFRDRMCSAGQVLQNDPMRGYLANLDDDEYKSVFRPLLPESMSGSQFIHRYESTIDQATRVQPEVQYPVRSATDHHVFEARRVRQFVRFLEEAAQHPPGTKDRRLALDKAGHLMYASHRSYTHKALLGAEECDLLVRMVRERERMGLYGAKITGGGSGGTVAVLADASPQADQALSQILRQYEQLTGHRPEAFLESGEGAWAIGTELVKLA